MKQGFYTSWHLESVSELSEWEIRRSGAARRQTYQLKGIHRTLSPTPSTCRIATRYHSRHFFLVWGYSGRSPDVIPRCDNICRFPDGFPSLFSSWFAFILVAPWIILWIFRGLPVDFPGVPWWFWNEFFKRFFLEQFGPWIFSYFFHDSDAGLYT